MTSFLSASLLGTHLWPRVFNKARTTGKWPLSHASCQGVLLGKTKSFKDSEESHSHPPNWLHPQSGGLHPQSPWSQIVLVRVICRIYNYVHSMYWCILQFVRNLYAYSGGRYYTSTKSVIMHPKSKVPIVLTSPFPINSVQSFHNFLTLQHQRLTQD
jgi:hypothetical protein